MFTVARDASRPFIVRTSRAVAIDLGTRFVVRAYADDPVTDIVVAEGSVAALPAGPDSVSAAGDSLVLQRGQRARVARDGRMQFTARAPLEEYLDWTEGRLRFNGTPLRDAVRRLERWYDIDIRLTPDAVGDRPIVARQRTSLRPTCSRRSRSRWTYGSPAAAERTRLLPTDVQSGSGVPR